MRRTRTEQWLFARPGGVAQLAATCLACGALVLATLLASDLGPQNHFTVFNLANAAALIAVPAWIAGLAVLWLMAVYLARYDPQPHANRKRWVPWFIVGGALTAIIYCFAVYRKQAPAVGGVGLPRRPWRAP